MTRRRSQVFAAGVLAAVLAVACGLANLPSASSNDSSRDGPESKPISSRSPRPGTDPPPARTPASDPETDETEACRTAIQEADRIAREMAAECELDLAERGLCVAPVPFEHENQPASQVANTRDLLAPCGLDEAQVRFECSENPCLTLIDREVLVQGSIRCEPLRAVATRLAAIDQRLPPEGVWSDWTPLMFDTPTDPVDAIRAAGRFGARAAKAERLVSDDRSGGAETCAQAHAAIGELRSPDRCDALRAYWSCPASPIELPAGTVEAYVHDAEATYESLIDTCPAFASSNHVFDCSGVPCILLVERAPDQQPEQVFCGRSFGSTVSNEDNFAVWMYRGIDQPVFDRFDEEREFRYQLARATLEAQRTP